MCCDKIHIVMFHSQFFVSYSEYVSYISKNIYLTYQFSFMFYDFLGSDPKTDLENLTGGGGYNFRSKQLPLHPKMDLMCIFSYLVPLQADLGVCPKIHDDDMRKQYEEAKESSRKLAAEDEFLRLVISIGKSCSVPDP